MSHMRFAWAALARLGWSRACVFQSSPRGVVCAASKTVLSPFFSPCSVSKQILGDHEQ